MALRQSDAVEVRQVKGKGRGVFARRTIAKGEVFERVPVLVLPIAEIQNDDGWSGLASYCFNWGQGTVALALGYGSMYNHSFRPNAKYEDIGRRTKVFSAIREIRVGEEVTINYNADPKDRSPVGFTVIERPRVAASRLSAAAED
jgi:SET domain-containing protein